MTNQETEHMIFVYYNKKIPGEWTFFTDEEKRETIFIYQENDVEKTKIIKWDDFLSSQPSNTNTSTTLHPQSPLPTNGEKIVNEEINIKDHSPQTNETHEISFKEMNNLIFDNQLEYIDTEEKTVATFNNIKYVYNKRN